MCGVCSALERESASSSVQAATFVKLSGKFKNLTFIKFLKAILTQKKISGINVTSPVRRLYSRELCNNYATIKAVNITGSANTNQSETSPK